MLGVACTALAFGGIFNHGSKSTTYKGGVDAIGVHFGGEKKTADSEPKEETCPPEKQCGETCCGAGNVCVDDNKCCFGNSADDYNEELCCDVSESTGYAWTDGWHDKVNSCCPNNRSLTSFLTPMENLSVCCSENEYAFISWYDPNGIFDGAHVAGACCAKDHVVVISDGSKEGAWYLQECCPAGSTGWGNSPETKESGCCEAGTIPVEDEGGDGLYCCPEGSTVYDNNQCCGQDGTSFVEDVDGDSHCCPEGSMGYENGECI